MRLVHCCVATYGLLLEPSQDYVPCRKQEILPCSERVNAMFLSHLVGVYRQWRRYNESLRELNRLGDRELADIGISRGDIPRVAWETSEH
jgi:uncharacterized protein YjiS (DUF1127 family)